MKILSMYGTYAGEPYVKYISGDIWELRPINERILFFGWSGAQFIMLHSFVKKSKKIPQKEFDQAKRNMQDFIKRSSGDEQK
jgi:phage-related protein